VRHFIHANFGDDVTRVQCKLKIGLGKVAKEIVTAACQEEADLIVMAKKKKRPLSRLLSRSISEAVGRQAPCPVLSVSPPQIQRLWRGWRAPLIGGVVQGSEA
jgi:nucleotide-binding universal stress UspA family protein